MSTRWQKSSAPRGDEYDARWRALEADGRNIHGEADLVEALLREFGGTRVLDAGCGTGRIAIELARRQFSVTGVDVDAQMLEAARSKAPKLPWIEADLADLGNHLSGQFDLVLLAGNVMIFVDPGTEGRVLAEVAARLTPGGVVVAGFQLLPERLALQDYDRLADLAGLDLLSRWATWDREPEPAGGDATYAVSMHRRRR